MRRCASDIWPAVTKISTKMWLRKSVKIAHIHLRKGTIQEMRRWAKRLEEMIILCRVRVDRPCVPPGREGEGEGGEEEEPAKVELPVLCQEDGKTVLRFSELFGVGEPYWVIGQRKGRQKRVSTRGQSWGSQNQVILLLMCAGKVQVGTLFDGKIVLLFKKWYLAGWKAIWKEQQVC